MIDSHRPAASANARLSDTDNTDDESTKSMVISKLSESGSIGTATGAAVRDGANTGAEVRDGARVGMGEQEPHENPKFKSGMKAHLSSQSIQIPKVLK